MPTPSIGRIVHYQTYGTPGGEFRPQPLAALITGVRDDFGTDDAPESRVSLVVFYDNGFSNKTNVRFSEEPKPGHWSWPPRVDG
ncbi:hypothetical protein [Nocardia sp. N2S4-5]|uniref:hypothetical protein n=1 Tax=Nocardia sp. N2S4-5 TaxID=3351565 RepID=UPI0037CE5799